MAYNHRRLRLIKEDGIHQKVKTEGRKESRSNFGWAKDFYFYFIFHFILLGAVEARTSQHCGRTSKLYVVQSKKENTDLRGGGKGSGELCVRTLEHISFWYNETSTRTVFVIQLSIYCCSTLPLTSSSPPSPFSFLSLLSSSIFSYHILRSFFLSTSTKAITKLSHAKNFYSGHRMLLLLLLLPPLSL